MLLAFFFDHVKAIILSTFDTLQLDCIKPLLCIKKLFLQRVRSLFWHYWSNLKKKKSKYYVINTIRTGSKVIFRHWVKLFPARLKITLLRLCVNTSYKLAVKHINSFHLLSQKGSQLKLSGKKKDMLSWWKMGVGKLERNLKMEILCATVWIAILHFPR